MNWLVPGVQAAQQQRVVSTMVTFQVPLCQVQTLIQQSVVLVSCERAEEQEAAGFKVATICT